MGAVASNIGTIMNRVLYHTIGPKMSIKDDNDNSSSFCNIIVRLNSLTDLVSEEFFQVDYLPPAITSTKVMESSSDLTSSMLHLLEN